MVSSQSQGIPEYTFKHFVLVQPAPLEKGWYEATLKRTGKRGLVPSNYVRLETIPPDGPATSGTMPRKKVRDIDNNNNDNDV
jgi:hypothetical protein